jgi:hypothetical protein
LFFQLDNPRVTPVENPNLTYVQDLDPINLHTEVAELNQQETLATTFEREPGKHVQILRLPFYQQDEAQRFYISEVPYQVILDEYPLNDASHARRFQSNWFNQFSWLEYSPHTDRAYCLPCFLFSKKPIEKYGSDTFTVKGFNNWKKVNEGKECAFLKHMGNSGSGHKYSVGCFNNLKNSMAHIDKVVVKENEKLVAEARLRLTTTINSIR